MKTIITIGRQYGSGGREVGQKLARHYGINFYDSELLSKVAKDSGFCQEIVQQQDERPTSSFLYNLVMDTYSFGFNNTGFTDMPISQKVFLAQFDTIKKLGQTGGCVIVGRAADYILREYKNLTTVFVHASLDYRIQRVAEFEKITDAKAKDMILKADKKRASFYNFQTDKKWGAVSSYNLSVDTSDLGIEGAVKLIKNYIEIKNAK